MSARYVTDARLMDSSPQTRVKSRSLVLPGPETYLWARWIVLRALGLIFFPRGLVPERVDENV